MLALKRISSLIVTLGETGRVLQRPEAAYLDQLVEGLRRYPDSAQRRRTLSKYAPVQITSLQANLLVSDIKSGHFSSVFDNASALKPSPLGYFVDCNDYAGL